MTRFKVGLRYILYLVGFITIVSLILEFNDRVTELRRLSAQKIHVVLKVTDYAVTQRYLETRIAYATSEAAVEDWAYQEGMMVRQGDNPVIPIPEAVLTPQPTPPPQATQTIIRNWQVWLALFFDFPDTLPDTLP